MPLGYKNNRKYKVSARPREGGGRREVGQNGVSAQDYFFAIAQGALYLAVLSFFHFFAFPSFGSKPTQHLFKSPAIPTSSSSFHTLPIITTLLVTITKMNLFLPFFQSPF